MDNLETKTEKPIMECPQWLKDRREANRILVESMTPEERNRQVDLQWKAVAKLRKENAHCPKHKDYDMVNKPECNCYHCWTAYFHRHQTEEARNALWEAMDRFDGLQC